MSDHAFFAVKLVLVESIFGERCVAVVQARVNVTEHTAYRFVVESVDRYGVCEPKVGVEVFGFYVVEALIEELGGVHAVLRSKAGDAAARELLRAGVRAAA